MFNLADFERLSPASFSGAGSEVDMSSARGGVKVDAFKVWFSMLLFYALGVRWLDVAVL
jgi:hypothetical protein